MPVIGRSVRRIEDGPLLVGKGRFAADVNFPGQLHMRVVRSPLAHGRILAIDASEALALPGVIAVWTGANVADVPPIDFRMTRVPGLPPYRQPILAQAKVRYVGDHVAVVIAETLDQAKDAAGLIQVDYGELPAVVDVATAQAAGKAQLHDEAPNNTVYQWHLGDKDAVDAAFAKAAHVTKLDIINNRLVPNAMEPRAAIGDYDAGQDQFTLYTTSQNPHVARLVLSAFIGIAPEHKLRVIAPDVGGGFGSKIFIYAEETVCIWAAKKVGRPVKWVAERTEAFLADAHGRDHVTTAELALDASGKILALRASTKANLGAYL